MLVAPGAFGVLDESRPFLDDQDAFVHTYTVSRKALDRVLDAHPRKRQILDSVTASMKRDEHDVPTPEDSVVPLGGSRYEVDATVPLEEINDRLGLHLAVRDGPAHAGQPGPAGGHLHPDPERLQGSHPDSRREGRQVQDHRLADRPGRLLRRGDHGHVRWRLPPPLRGPHRLTGSIDVAPGIPSPRGRDVIFNRAETSLPDSPR